LTDFGKILWNLNRRNFKNCQALSFVNSTQWLQASDYGQAHFLDDVNLSAYSDYTRVWYYRNESTAERIIQAAKASTAEKMVVFYGYMPISPVKKYLEERGYKVRLIGDLE